MVVVGAGGLHVGVVAVRAEPREARAVGLLLSEAGCDGLVAPFAFVAKALRRIAFQLDPLERDAEDRHVRGRIGSIRDLRYVPGLEYGLDRVRIAAVGKRAGGMAGDAVGVVLGDLAQVLGGQFRCRDRVVIAGPAGP